MTVGPGSGRPRPKTAVIVPAHNEAATIARCLGRLLGGAEPDDFEVVVACNGCTDDTADLARSIAAEYPGVTVEVRERQKPGKAAAMNDALDLILADRETVPNVVFLDSDSDLPATTIRAVVAALDQPGVMAASTGIEVHDQTPSAVVRSYQRYWKRIPSIRRGLAGRGIYALNAQGLKRLGRFPDIIADDRYIDLLFSDRERAMADEAATIDPAPSVGDLIGRKSRVFAGNKAIESPPGEASSQTGGLPAVLQPLAETRSLQGAVDLVVYLAVNATAKLLAGRWSTHATSWQSAR